MDHRIPRIGDSIPNTPPLVPNYAIKNTMKITLFVLFAMLAALPATAEIYKWTDVKGNVHFGDSKPKMLEAENVEVEINTYTNVVYDSSIFDAGRKVVMYSTSWCKYCKKARKYFTENDIDFAEYDIEKNSKARRQYDRLGVSGVPVILVGKKQMRGFSVGGFRKIYQP